MNEMVRRGPNQFARQGVTFRQSPGAPIHPISLSRAVAGLLGTFQQ